MSGRNDEDVNPFPYLNEFFPKIQINVRIQGHQGNIDYPTYLVSSAIPDTCLKSLSPLDFGYREGRKSR